MLRPERTVLPDQALVPEKNFISPAPNQFTHELTRPQPYYFKGVQQGGSPDGKFPAGTPVVLLRYEGGVGCWVVDGQGLYVEVEYDSLRPPLVQGELTRPPG